MWSRERSLATAAGAPGTTGRAAAGRVREARMVWVAARAGDRARALRGAGGMRHPRMVRVRVPPRLAFDRRCFVLAAGVEERSRTADKRARSRDSARARRARQGRALLRRVRGHP